MKSAHFTSMSSVPNTQKIFHKYQMNKQTNGYVWPYYLSVEAFSLHSWFKIFWKKQMGWAWWLTSIISALWEAQADRSLEFRSSRPAWPTRWNPVSTKNTKISWACWLTPAIPALSGLRQENHLNLGGGGCSELKLHHCTPAWWQDSISRKKRKEKSEHTATHDC